MHYIDWIILIGTVLFIVIYGMWKTRSTQDIESYLLGDRDLKWWTIGLSIMATQASGITFLSTPGQAFEDGMGFIQFYLGLPLAMVILSVYFLPIYYNLKVYTAYEYLEQRFGLVTRTFTAILFLLQRGFAAGLTIYAPSIIMAKIFDWNLGMTNLAIGSVVIIYTVVGGTKAVSETQQQQMAIIFLGLLAALITVLYKLPPDVTFTDAVNVAGNLGKMNIIDTSFKPENKYNIWSGLLGGTFLFLSYFGTDQSQVQRYLSGKTLTQSRLGLLFNGILKIPMQFTVLFVGMMVFVFHLFNPSPLHFNSDNIESLKKSPYASEYAALEKRHDDNFQRQKDATYQLVQAQHTGDPNQIESKKVVASGILKEEKFLRDSTRKLVVKMQGKKGGEKDTDYIFITFVLKQLPVGLIGLLIAVIFAAAMSSISSEINALATTSIIDIYRRSLVKNASDKHYLNASMILTVVWGGIALAFASLAALFENLIQAVNIIGSIFYGVILGIFLVAFFFKKIKEKAVMVAASISQVAIITLFTLDKMEILKIAFLWFNLIGPFLVIGLSMLFQSLFNEKTEEKA
jgi:solute:Na+ symporter, SSS family